MTERSVEEIREALSVGRAVLRYIVTDEAWYADAAMKARDPHVVRELAIGVDARNEVGDEDGTYGEGTIEWIELGEPAAKLQLFYDGWRALGAVPGFWDLLVKLGDTRHSPTFEDVRAGLEDLGFRDMTDRQDPYQRSTS